MGKNGYNRRCVHRKLKTKKSRQIRMIAVSCINAMNFRYLSQHLLCIFLRHLFDGDSNLRSEIASRIDSAVSTTTQHDSLSLFINFVFILKPQHMRPIEKP